MWGDPFRAISVDLAEFSELYNYPTTVPFVGYRRDGTVVTTEFTTDGIIDGTGPLPDFQTFYFDSRFSDVMRIEVPTYGWALDNFVWGDIPEPSVATIGLLGSVLLFARAIRRRRLSISAGPTR